MNNPCYKCPYRKAECGLFCEKWQAYTAERNKKYSEKAKANEMKRMWYDHMKNVNKSIEQKKKDRRRGFK